MFQQYGLQELLFSEFSPLQFNLQPRKLIMQGNSQDLHEALENML